MNLNKKNEIIKAFEAMNISMLDVLLDDNKTYQDTTKEVFLEKLKALFDCFQREGDTMLLAHNGVCNGEGCSSYGCNGFAFVGNKSKHHLDLVYQEDENDYTDIFHCSSLKFAFAEELNTQIELNVWDDERVEFKPETDFLLSSLRCKKAIEELRKHYILDKEIYLPWLTEYADLWEKYFSPFSVECYWSIYSGNYLSEMGFIEFENLYSEIQMFEEMLYIDNLAGYVVRNFDLHFMAETDDFAKEWLAKKYPEVPWGVYTDLDAAFEDEKFRSFFQ